MAVTASSVSAVLRRSGFNPVGSYSREGVMVKGGGRNGEVTVVVTIDSERVAASMVQSVVSVLESKGYRVTPNPHSPVIVTVSKEV